MLDSIDVTVLSCANLSKFPLACRPDMEYSLKLPLACRPEQYVEQAVCSAVQSSRITCGFTFGPCAGRSSQGPGHCFLNLWASSRVGADEVLPGAQKSVGFLAGAAFHADLKCEEHALQDDLYLLCVVKQLRYF